MFIFCTVVITVDECICCAQTMDRDNPWIALPKVWIRALRKNPWIVCSIHGSRKRGTRLEVWISAKPLMHGRSSEAEDSGYKTTDVRH